MIKQPTIYTKSLFAMMLLIMAGCKSTEQPLRETVDTGYYQNVLGSDLIREQITRSFDSVRRIQNNVIYRTYQFGPEQLPCRSELQNVSFSDAALRSQTDSHSTAGTATVLHSRGGRALMLTAAHTVVQPDTIWHYQAGTTHQPEPIVEAVSVKESVNQYVFSDGGIVMIELVAYDSRRDLALMITQEDVAAIDNLIQLGLRGGDFSQLQWGDVVFAMGYPRGVQMVSQGVVSRSNHPIRRITVDLSINRGFSGGPTFAVRNDGGLEMIGIITSAMGTREFFLTPGDQLEEDFNPELPYSGDIFIGSSQRIFYGITHVVDIEQIRVFLQENFTLLRRYGISITTI